MRPRQVGKTTQAKLIAPERLRYLDLGRTSDINRLTDPVPNQYQSDLPLKVEGPAGAVQSAVSSKGGECFPG